MVGFKRILFLDAQTGSGFDFFSGITLNSIKSIPMFTFPTLLSSNIAREYNGLSFYGIGSGSGSRFMEEPDPVNLNQDLQLSGIK